MVVIPIFGGLLAGILAILWPSQLALLPRILLAIVSASVTALLFALTVYFSQLKFKFKCQGYSIRNIWIRKAKRVNDGG